MTVPERKKMENYIAILTSAVIIFILWLTRSKPQKFRYFLMMLGCIVFAFGLVGSIYGAPLAVIGGYLIAIGAPLMFLSLVAMFLLLTLY